MYIYYIYVTQYLHGTLKNTIVHVQKVRALQLSQNIVPLSQLLTTVACCNEGTFSIYYIYVFYDYFEWVIEGVSCELSNGSE